MGLLIRPFVQGDDQTLTAAIDKAVLGVPNGSVVPNRIVDVQLLEKLHHFIRYPINVWRLGLYLICHKIQIHRFTNDTFSVANLYLFNGILGFVVTFQTLYEIVSAP